MSWRDYQSYHGRIPRNSRSRLPPLALPTARLRMDGCSWEELIMAERVEITGPTEERYVEILSPKALELLVMLHDALADRRAEALAARRRRQTQLSGGAMLDFLQETEHIRADDAWRVAAPGPGLGYRRAGVTGAADNKMTINPLYSGA